VSPAITNTHPNYQALIKWVTKHKNKHWVHYHTNEKNRRLLTPLHQIVAALQKLSTMKHCIKLLLHATIVHNDVIILCTWVLRLGHIPTRLRKKVVSQFHDVGLCALQSLS
jgi:hypothetical protein